MGTGIGSCHPPIGIGSGFWHTQDATGNGIGHGAGVYPYHCRDLSGIGVGVQDSARGAHTRLGQRHGAHGIGNWHGFGTGVWQGDTALTLGKEQGNEGNTGNCDWVRGMGMAHAGACGTAVGKGNGGEIVLDTLRTATYIISDT